MEQIYEQKITVSPSICDVSGRLGFHNAFGLCMDIAASHAQALGCGVYDLSARDLFWITVKTQLFFHARPRMMEEVTLRTWPEAPGRLRGNRSYEMRRGDEVLIAGKTEWAVINTKTKQPFLLSGVYPEGLTFSSETASPAPFARIPNDFSGCEAISRYTVCSTDIDVGGHMNNAAYLRAILGAFSNEQLRELRIGRMDVIFRSSCYEGETLTLQRKPAEGGLILRFMKEDASTALLLRIGQK